MNSLVSAIISIYNQSEDEITQAIRSIQHQTYTNMEIIILLDNPEDLVICNTVNKIIEGDSRAKFYVNDRNIGLPLSLNKGLSLATGEYILRMDADDVSIENRVEKELEFLIQHNLDVVSALKVEVDENNKVLAKKYHVVMLPKDVEYLLPYSCFINHPTVLMKKSVIDSLNGYRNINSAEDYDLWLRVLSKGYKIGVMDEFLLNYRVKNSGMSRSDLYRQLLTADCIRSLYVSGKLLLCEINEEIDNYLNRNRYNNELIKKRFNRSYLLLLESRMMFNEHKIVSGFYRLIISIIVSSNRKIMLKSLLEYKLRYFFWEKKQQNNVEE